MRARVHIKLRTILYLTECRTQVPYETEVLENATPGTTVFNTIRATDKDMVGETLNISCLSSQGPLIKPSMRNQQSTLVDPCTK